MKRVLTFALALAAGPALAHGSSAPHGHVAGSLPVALCLIAFAAAMIFVRRIRT